MFRWTLNAEVTSKAKPQDVWEMWIDVPSWPTWDHDLEWGKLEGPFKKGTQGKLKPKGWPASKFTLISVEEGKSHSDKTQMPLTSVIFNHTLTPVNSSEVKIVHHVEVKGLLAPLLWLTMRNGLKKGLPHAVKKLAELAEARSKEAALPS